VKIRHDHFSSWTRSGGVAIHGAAVQRDWSRKTATCQPLFWPLRLFLRTLVKTGFGGQVMDAKTVFILGLGMAILLLLGFCAIPL
jgi:hypothetical protein